MYVLTTCCTMICMVLIHVVCGKVVLGLHENDSIKASGNSSVTFGSQKSLTKLDTYDDITIIEKDRDMDDSISREIVGTFVDVVAWAGIERVCYEIRDQMLSAGKGRWICLALPSTVAYHFAFYYVHNNNMLLSYKEYTVTIFQEGD